MFQFHNGSIKRMPNHHYNPDGHLFQFHNGSIKSLEGPQLLTYLYTFQFHNGSIKRQHATFEKAKIDAVSIPQWFD